MQLFQGSIGVYWDSGPVLMVSHDIVVYESDEVDPYWTYNKHWWVKWTGWLPEYGNTK